MLNSRQFRDIEDRTASLLTAVRLGVNDTALYRMELAPCSLTTIAWFADGNSSLFGFAESAHLRGVDTGFGV